MFEHELEAAIADYKLFGPGSPSLRARIEHLHRVLIVAHADRVSGLLIDLKAIQAFLAEMRAFGLLDGLPTAYSGLTLQNLLPPSSNPKAVLLQSAVERPKRRKKKRKKKHRKRSKQPKLIFTAFESNRRRH